MSAKCHLPPLGFHLKKNTPMSRLKARKDIMSLRFRGEKAADPAGLADEKGQITETLTTQKQRRIFEDLLTSLRNSGKIVIENGYLYPHVYFKKMPVL